MTPGEIAEMLRLHDRGLSLRAIERATGVPFSTVRYYVRRLKVLHERDKHSKKIDHCSRCRKPGHHAPTCDVRKGTKRV